jgi:hypothetical protein
MTVNNATLNRNLMSSSFFLLPSSFFCSCPGLLSCQLRLYQRSGLRASLTLPPAGRDGEGHIELKEEQRIYDVAIAPQLGNMLTESSPAVVRARGRLTSIAVFVTKIG